MLATTNFLGSDTPWIMYCIGVVIGIINGWSWTSIYHRRKRGRH